MTPARPSRSPPLAPLASYYPCAPVRPHTPAAPLTQPVNSQAARHASTRETRSLNVVAQVPAVCRRSVVLGQLQGEDRADGCRVHFVASVCCGRLLAPVEQLRHPVAPPSAPLGATGAAVSVEAQVDEPLTTLVAVVVDPSGRMVGSSGFSLPPWAQGASHQAYQLSLGEAAGRLSFVASFP